MVGVREPLQRPQKENVAEFVARKREIFLVQMSLDTKRAEIRALQVRSGWTALPVCLPPAARLDIMTCTLAIARTHDGLRCYSGPCTALH